VYIRIHDGKQDKNLAEFFKQSFSFDKLHKFCPKKLENYWNLDYN